jgi:hypothetical protein
MKLCPRKKLLILASELLKRQKKRKICGRKEKLNSTERIKREKKRKGSCCFFELIIKNLIELGTFRKEFVIKSTTIIRRERKSKIR